ncbi:CvpA family protein [Arenimonas fontis]|uniref:CvpA family protein n=1 Tax=Arenimonas fontis TaxID=2608255 RepID=A0A5B2ZCT8_9GAMM|nr:CvpA family protein [Arenimonas fontis]KAA2285817.1 CvpA family protein [Arenimonas fontis]
MLTVADYVLLVVLLVSMAVGLWRGFLVEVLSLTVWVAAFWLSVGFGGEVAAWFSGVEQAAARLFLGHASVFLAVLLAGGLLTWLLGRFIAGTGLSGTDRVLGLGFGLARGLVLGCAGVLLLGFTPLPGDPWWGQSRLLPGFQRGAEWMAGFLPPAAAAELNFPEAVRAAGETGGSGTAAETSSSAGTDAPGLPDVPEN